MKEAEQPKAQFQQSCRQKGFEDAAAVLERDWDRMITFFRFPEQHWKHLRTTNVVESPFASPRLRTNAAKRCKKVENATAVIWKMLRIAEKKFRRLDAPELLKGVWSGTHFVDGVAIKMKNERQAA